MESLGVAEVKRRFAELIDRVQRGERFVVERRGRPVVALVPADEVGDDAVEPVGFGAFIGALAGWDEELDEITREAYELRRQARERPTPELD